MSAAGATSTLRTVIPLMDIPRIASATCSASSSLAASLTPPALPRPPTSTCALITTCDAWPAPWRSLDAAARASAGERATSHAGTGRPWASSSFLASASWIFTGWRWYPAAPSGRGGPAQVQLAGLRDALERGRRLRQRPDHRVGEAERSELVEYIGEAGGVRVRAALAVRLRARLVHPQPDGSTNCVARPPNRVAR